MGDKGKVVGDNNDESEETFAPNDRRGGGAKCGVDCMDVGLS